MRKITIIAGNHKDKKRLHISNLVRGKSTFWWDGIPPGLKPSSTIEMAVIIHVTMKDKYKINALIENDYDFDMIICVKDAKREHFAIYQLSPDWIGKISLDYVCFDKDPVIPQQKFDLQQYEIPVNKQIDPMLERFTMAAMQGLLASGKYFEDPKVHIAKMAVQQAIETIKQLKA